MRAPLRVGLVGYGLGGSVFHAPLIEATEGLSLEAVVTSDRQRAEAVRRRYPRAQVVGSVEDLLSDAAALDVVVVAVPNARHFEVAEAALRAGLTTIVDKPVTPTSAEARDLAQIAEERGVSVIPYHNRRWDGDYLTVEGLVRSGRLGDVWRFESRFERWRPGPPPARTWKHDPSQPGGGSAARPEVQHRPAAVAQSYERVVVERAQAPGHLGVDRLRAAEEVQRLVHQVCSQVEEYAATRL